MNESLMYGFEDEYNAVTLMLSLTKETACAADLPGVEVTQNHPSGATPKGNNQESLKVIWGSLHHNL
jgi:hypothetical protein